MKNTDQNSRNKPLIPPYHGTPGAHWKCSTLPPPLPGRRTPLSGHRLCRRRGKAGPATPSLNRKRISPQNQEKKMLKVSPHGWLSREAPPPTQPPKTIAEIFSEHEEHNSPAKGEVCAAAQRAAEWGLVLKTDEETGKPQGVKVRTSGDEPNKQGNTRMDSGNSVRSSGNLSDDGTGKERGFPRV